MVLIVNVFKQPHLADPEIFIFINVRSIKIDTNGIRNDRRLEK